MVEVGEINQGFETDVKVMLARIEERQVSTSKEIVAMKDSVTIQFNSFKTDYDHKLAQVKQAQMLYMPAKEIDHKIEIIKNHCDANREALSGRVDTLAKKVEDFGALGAKLFWSLVSLAGTVALGLATWFVKMALSGTTL